PVLLLTMPALRASTTRVLCLHPFNPDSCQPRLIGDELLKTVEGPGVQGAATVPAVAPPTIPDTLQLLHADGANATGEAQVHDSAANLMVLVPHPPRFL